MLHDVCRRVVLSSAKQIAYSPQQIEWAIYVLECRLQDFIGTVLVFFLGSLVAPTAHVAAYLCSTYLISTRSGGYHCSTRWKCLALSIISSWLFLFSAKLLTSFPWIVCLLLVVATVILSLAPVNHISLHLNKKEIINNRKKLRFNQVVVLAIFAFLWVMNSETFIYVALGYLCSALSVLLQIIDVQRRSNAL